MSRLLPLLVLCLLPGLGWGQVIVHQAALDQLAGIVPVASATAAPPPAPIRRIVRRAPRKHLSAPSAVAFDVPQPLPGAAPKTAATAAPPPVPAAPSTAPLKPATVSARAVPVVLRPFAASALVRFAAGSADLPAGAAGALKPICAAAEPAGTVDVQAPAPASPGDPSIGMRLSMQRAFALRDALTACGISPARIVPRAVGAAGGGDPDTARISLGAPK